MTNSTRTAALAALLAAATLAVPVAARADEQVNGVRGSGIVVHDASETLANYCQWTNGVLVFQVPGGDAWELVTSTSDPAIGNPGDGSFHPFDAAEVRSTLAAVRFPLSRVAAEIFILPYPRRAGLESAAGPGLILLSPGVRPVSVDQQHAEFVHEFGHVVQYALMPDADSTAWARYRSLRGITDATVYSASAIHVDRPHEIFAEDFRALFGDGAANYSGTIENTAIAYPTQVSGLTSFMLALAEAPVPATPVRVLAAARHGAVTLARDGAGAATLDVFDVHGRHLVALAAIADAAGCHWTWDGHDAQGATTASGVCFARARDGVGGVAKFVR